MEVVEVDESSDISKIDIIANALAKLELLNPHAHEEIHETVAVKK